MKRSLEEAKAARRRRWAQIEARQYPNEVVAYGFASAIAIVVFAVWYLIAPSLFSSVSLSASLVVLAATIATCWRLDDLAE